MTDHSPAELTAAVTNSSGSAVTVDLHADAGRNSVKVAAAHSDLASAKKNSIVVKVAAQSSQLVFIEVRPLEPIRRGKSALTVVATPRHPAVQKESKKPSDPLVIKEITVEMAGADLFPSFAQIGSAILVPGVLAVAAALQVWALDRRRLGLRYNAAAIMWDNKLWLLAALVISLVAVWLSTALFDRNDLLDAFSWWDLLLVSLGSAVAGAALSAVVLFAYRLRKRLISENSSPWDVLRAAARSGGPAFERPVFSTGGEQPLHGILVHHDGEASVLTPPVRVSGPDGLVNLCDLPQDDSRRTLKRAVKEIKRGRDHFNSASYAQLDNWISGPTIVTAPMPNVRPPESIFTYEDPG